MTSIYTSLTTSKLAQEQNVEIIPHSFYRESGVVTNIRAKAHIPRFTHEELHEYLRDNHALLITIFPDFRESLKYKYIVRTIAINGKGKYYMESENSWPSYNEAFDNGLKGALILINHG